MNLLFSLEQFLDILNICLLKTNFASYDCFANREDPWSFYSL